MPLDSNVYDYTYTPSVDFSAGQSPDTLVSNEHVLQPSHEEAIDKVVSSPDWILGVLVLILLILAWVRVYHLKRLKQLLQAFLYKLHVFTILRSNDSMIKRISLGLNAIFILTMSLFLYQLIEHYDVFLPFANTENSFFLILPVVLLLYLLTSLVLLLVVGVFSDSA